MFEPGMQMAVLSGDPTKAEHFTVRVKVPAGYLIKPHWHPADEHVTVVSGLINVGILNSMEPVTTLDRAIAKAYGVGSFATMPARKPHFAFAGPEGVELQIHGMGPFAMTYLDPQDDPRNRRR
jgi:quercetin dioxygenase-like cupin family protein